MGHYSVLNVILQGRCSIEYRWLTFLSFFIFPFFSLSIVGGRSRTKVPDTKAVIRLYYLLLQSHTNRLVRPSMEDFEIIIKNIYRIKLLL